MAVTYSQNGVIVKAPPTTVATSSRIDSQQGINIVDANGYIGAVITDYFPHVGNTYYNNFAVIVNSADFSQSGLGQVTFITPGSADIGGRTYRTVNIGGVEWLAENLDYKFSGCNIGGSGTPSTPNAWYYNNDEATYGIDGTRKCGLMYNWYAVKLLNDNRSTLIPGWHVPTDGEWTALANAVGGTSTAGTKLKAANISWEGITWGGTDDYGFGALPGGDRDYDDFRSVAYYGRYWAITESGNDGYGRQFDTGAAIIPDLYGKYRGQSVRLVRDST